MTVRGAAVVAVTAILFNTNAHAGSSAFKTYGDVASFAIPAFAAGVSLYKDDEQGLGQLGLGFLLSMGATYGLKKTVHRWRPDRSDDESFPSGHTARAFAGASYLQFRYGSAYGVPMLLASGAVGWSRVDADKHHWTDVIAAGVLSTAVAWFTTSRYKELPVNVSVMMGEDENRTYGLAAQMRF